VRDPSRDGCNLMAADEDSTASIILSQSGMTTVKINSLLSDSYDASISGTKYLEHI